MRRRVGSAIVGAALLGACGLTATGGVPASKSVPESTSPRPRILFLAPGPENDPRYLAAFRGAQVSLAVTALAGPTLELVWSEIPGDASSWAPPEAAGAIIAPGTAMATLADLRGALQVPVVSLTGGHDLGWSPLVASARDIASRMLDVGGEDPCLISAPDGGDVSRYLRPAVRRVALGEAVDDPDLLTGCTGLLWTGGIEGATRLEAALAAAGARTDIIGTDAIRDGGQEDLASVGSRILVVSGAIDVSTRVDLASRRFVQDYQSQVGLPPGPFSVEAWDAAALLAEIIAEDGRRPEAFSGIGRVYDLFEGARKRVYLYRLVEGTWRIVRGR